MLRRRRRALVIEPGALRLCIPGPAVLIGRQTSMNVALEEAKAEPAGVSSRDLLSALRRLDILLQQAVRKAESTYGSKAAADTFRGLYLSHADAEDLLGREPGAPTLSAFEGIDLPAVHASNSPLNCLRRTFSLSDLDLDVVCLALAPELDLRYERLYAYLQDDVTRRHPTLDLALNLLCGSAEDKIKKRVHFAPEAPLLRFGLIHVFPDQHQSQPSLLAHYFRLDPQVVRMLLGQLSLDERLRSYCQLARPTVALDDVHVTASTRQALPFLVKNIQEHHARGFYFEGKRGTGKRQVAEALARCIGASLLTVDMGQAITREADDDEIVKLICREAKLQNAVLYLDEFDALRGDVRHKRLPQLLSEQVEGVVVMAGSKPWSSLSGEWKNVMVVPFSVATFEERYASWQRGLENANVGVDPQTVVAIADRFRLNQNQISEAIETARGQALWRAAQQQEPASGELQPTPQDLFRAARRHSGRELASLARKIESVQTWNDLVLPDDAMTQLQEIVLRMVHRHRVLHQWGFDRKLSSGKGVNALFAGTSGTGKTMAAEVIANELGLELYKVDLAGVVSKYIGETEKNLERIFDAAEEANAILFFDEADALFGKRSEVHDAHDRYANIEVAYLLQRMEQYEGISLLATNLRQNMDEAFVRRLAFIVQFPFPNVASRLRIWQGIWPREISFSDDVNLEHLASQYKLSGGNIKNIAFAAAFHAAADGGCVSMSHLLRATRREYQKMDRVLLGSELETLPVLERENESPGQPLT